MRTVSLSEEQIDVIGEALTEKSIADDLKRWKNEEKIAKLKEETEKLKGNIKINQDVIHVLGYFPSTSHIPAEKVDCKPKMK